jgi:hypothetical protein
MKFALEQAYEGVSNTIGDPLSPEVLLVVTAITALCAIMRGIG